MKSERLQERIRKDRFSNSEKKETGFHGNRNVEAYRLIKQMDKEWNTGQTAITDSKDQILQ